MEPGGSMLQSQGQLVCEPSNSVGSGAHVSWLVMLNSQIYLLKNISE